VNTGRIRRISVDSVQLLLVVGLLSACSRLDAASEGVASQAGTANSGDRTLAFSEFQEKLIATVPSLLASYHAPGIAVGLIRNGETVFTRGFGFGDIESRAPVTSGTVFNIGSASKSVTAWGVMHLVEQGKIDLDAPVSRYLTRWQLPESDFEHDGVTVRRLLSHTAGLSPGSYLGFLLDDSMSKWKT
jgi:CubicO group peptidase (beta-lactamase class C family)